MKRGVKIIYNRARCKLCGDIIESKSTHDFVGCSCFIESHGERGIAVDGGHAYIKRCGSPDACEEMSETRAFTDEEVDEYNKRMLRKYEEFGWAIDLME